MTTGRIYEDFSLVVAFTVALSLPPRRFFSLITGVMDG
jgi:hypothetical protein